MLTDFLTHHTAVDIEPPVTHEVLLVVEGAVGAEQGGDGDSPGLVSSAHVVGLAVSLLVSVVARHQPGAGEGGLRGGGEGGIVLAWSSRDSALYIGIQLHSLLIKMEFMNEMMKKMMQKTVMKEMRIQRTLK